MAVSVRQDGIPLAAPAQQSSSVGAAYGASTMNAVLRVRAPAPSALAAPPEAMPSGGKDPNAALRRDAAMLWDLGGSSSPEDGGAITLLSVNSTGVHSRHVLRPATEGEEGAELTLSDETIGTWELCRRSSDGEVGAGASADPEASASESLEWAPANQSYAGKLPKREEPKMQMEPGTEWTRAVEVRTYAAERLPIFANPQVKLMAVSAQESSLANTIAVPLAAPIPWGRDGDSKETRVMGGAELREMMAQAMASQLSPGADKSDSFVEAPPFVLDQAPSMAADELVAAMCDEVVTSCDITDGPEGRSVDEQEQQQEGEAEPVPAPEVMEGASDGAGELDESDEAEAAEEAMGAAAASCDEASDESPVDTGESNADEGQAAEERAPPPAEPSIVSGGGKKKKGKKKKR